MSRWSRPAPPAPRVHCAECCMVWIAEPPPRLCPYCGDGPVHNGAVRDCPECWPSLNLGGDA